MDDRVNFDDETTGGGHRGKFNDRLKKIRRDRLKLQRKKRLSDEKEENILLSGGRNLLKIFLALPSVAYSVMKDNQDFKIQKTKTVNSVNNLDSSKKTNDTRKIKVNKIREINVASLIKKKEMALKEKTRLVSQTKEKEINKVNDVEVVNVEKEERIVILQREIINLIKKQLVKNINELEILQSEFYLLKVVNGDDNDLKKCQEHIKEIKKMLSKINALKEKYDYLKDNYDFEYLFEHGDEVLIDKILELKDLCNSEDIKYVISNYKLLEEYKFLYLKIDKLQEDTSRFELSKKEKELELKERDINFEQLKKEVYNVDEENQRYNSFVKKQEFFLKQLEENVSKIDSHEKVTYKLKGFDEFVAHSFKFMGLMLLNPFKAFLPGIALSTLRTRNIIFNLYNNITWETKRKITYEAIDYSLAITVAKNNLVDTLTLVNSTLADISALKQRYQQEFAKYQGSSSSYKETIRKINKMENAILGNKIKIELMQEKMKIKEKENANKLERVKKLNCSNNNS